MFEGKKIIAVIPARGGSKSVPYKNIRPLAGKPLIVWSIEVGQGVKEIDRIIVSTDDEKIAAVARDHHAEVYERPASLATDEALVIDALRDLSHTLRAEGETAEIFVLLEPTCPLRAAEDVKKCIHLLVQGGYDAVATFKDADLNPHRAWKIHDHEPEVFISGAIPWLPRQKQPVAFQLNGAVYAFYSRLLEKDGMSLLSGRSGAVLMPKNRSIDIDDELDFDIIETIIRRNGR